MEKWAEHYQDLYSTVKNTTNLPIVEELDIPLTEEELDNAIDFLVCSKPPGKDDIPPEVIKARKRAPLLRHLHQLFLQCWEEGTVHQEMRDPYIVTRKQENGRPQ